MSLKFRKPISLGVFLLLFAVFVLAVQGEDITLLESKQVSTPTKVLSFPVDQCMGNLYVEPEGLALHPKYVSLQNVDEWDYVAAAQGQVRAPAGKRLQLNVLQTLPPAENARFRRQNQHAYQLTFADRICQDTRLARTIGHPGQVRRTHLLNGDKYVYRQDDKSAN